MDRFTLRSRSGKLGRRGFSADIFKWLFGLVAGAIILLFLVRFALQHVDLSSNLTAVEYAEYLDDQLEAFRAAESSSKTLSLPDDYTLQVLCEGFGVQRNLKQSNKIIFGPKSLQGNLGLWTVAWEFPFKVTNVYYIGDDHLRILLIYNDASAAYVKDLVIPSLFHVQKMHVRDFSVERLRRESGNDRVHLVFFAPVPSYQTINSRVSNVHVLEVTPAAHSIRYYNAGTDAVYFGEEMLIGAFFAPESFSCIQERALEWLRSVTDVHIRRADLLQLKTLESACGQALVDGKQALGQLQTARDAPAAYALNDQLEEQNRHLRRIDCATLY